jgi:hypothetical protein
VVRVFIIGIEAARIDFGLELSEELAEDFRRQKLMISYRLFQQATNSVDDRQYMKCAYK